MSLSSSSSRVQCDTPKPHASLRLLTELTQRGGKSSNGVTVTVDDLADALGVSRRTVFRASRDLAAAGLIEISKSLHRYAPNTYRVRPL